MSDTSVSFRIDQELKDKAVDLFEQLGLSLSAAIQVFLRQAVREGGLPFEVTTRVPTDATIAAMLEAERIAKDPEAASYHTVEEMLKNLKQ